LGDFPESNTIEKHYDNEIHEKKRIIESDGLLEKRYQDFSLTKTNDLQEFTD